MSTAPMLAVMGKTDVTDLGSMSLSGHFLSTAIAAESAPFTATAVRLVTLIALNAYSTW